MRGGGQAAAGIAAHCSRVRPYRAALRQQAVRKQAGSPVASTAAPMAVRAAMRARRVIFI